MTNSIDYLAKANVYFHRSANQFSNGMTGSQFIDDEIGAVHWELVQDATSFQLRKENSVIAHFSLNEILTLLARGRRQVENLRANYNHTGEVISREHAAENHRQIRKMLLTDYAVMYSNDLVALDVGIDPPVTDVEYPLGIRSGL